MVREATTTDTLPQDLRASTLTDKSRKHGKPKKVKAAKNRESFSGKLREHAGKMRVMETMAAPSGEGPRIKLVLIDEGLGNLRTKNYYGPEAIESAVRAFEGKPCYFDHPSESEGDDIPERRTRSLCGYYKNLHIENLKAPGRSRAAKSCVGELHFDLSEDGKKAHEKALTALHFQKEFPGSKLQYVGWSVLGDGDGERGVTMSIGADMLEAAGGEEMEVNYVTAFTEGDSCDMVTRAARGGRALGTIAESEDGSRRIISEEASMDLKKKLTALLARLTESAKKATEDNKADIEESKKLAGALLAAVEAAPPVDDASEEDYEAMCAKREGEADEDHKARLQSMAKAIGKHLGSAAAGEAEPDGDGDDDEEEPAAQESSRRAVTKPLTASELKRNRIAVLHVMQESGLPAKGYSDEKITRLARLPFEEAEQIIKDDARMAEAVMAESDEAVAHLGGRVRESAGAGDRTSSFAEAFHKEA